jgi:hypothetical protein
MARSWPTNRQLLQRVDELELGIGTRIDGSDRRFILAAERAKNPRRDRTNHVKYLLANQIAGMRPDRDLRRIADGAPALRFLRSEEAENSWC